MKTAPAIGLRGRLLLLLLALFALQAGLIAWHFIHDREARLAAALEDIEGDTRTIAARQQAITARADAVLNGLMLRRELQPSASVEACARFLAARIELEAGFIQSGRVLPNGDVACAAVPPKGLVNFSDRNWFRQALTTQDLVIGNLVVGRILGKPLITFAKAMRDETGRVASVLYLSLDLAWLHRHLEAAHRPEGTDLAVVDAKGTLAVRHPDPEGWAGRSAADQPIVRRVLAADGKGTLEETGLDGRRRIFAHVRLLDSVSGPYILWMSVPKEAIEAPVRRDVLLGLGIMLAMFLSTMGVVVWGGNRLLLKPLLTLSRTASRLGAGELGMRSGLPHGDDEIGRLARALDGSAAAIEEREHRLAYANRALRVLSAVNNSLLHATNEQELLDGMCRSIVEAGGYHIAWVGYAEDDTERSVRSVAAWGAGADFFDGLNLTWDETESGRGPTGTAIRQGIPVAANNLLTDADYAPWRERAQRYGYGSSLALPLCIDGAVIGVLNVYAAEADAFDEGVIEVLRESADNLAFGIATRRAEAEHGRTRAALQTAEERFQAAAAASLDALFILKGVRDGDGKILDFEFTDINTQAERMLGMARGQVIGQKLCELLPINRTGGFFDKYVTVTETGVPLEEEFPIDTPEIRAKWLRHQVVRVDDGVAISSRDITAWKAASAEIRQQGRLRTMILKSAGEGIFGLDLEGRATFANPAACAMLQWKEEEVLGQPAHPLHHHTREDGTPYPAEGCPIHAAYRDGEVRRVRDEVFWRMDGTSFPVEYVSTPIRDDREELNGAVVSFNDITERREQEKALARARRALLTLSAGNEALVRAASEEELLQAVVRVIVEQGDYRMARVSYAADDPEKTLRRMACTAANPDFCEEQFMTWSAGGEGCQVPIARAIRGGAAVICHDIAADPGFAPWREAALAQGFVANLGLPLSDGGGVFGGLSIYAAETESFDEEETRLLTELADDLAYGILSLRTRAERDRIAHAHAHHAEILQRSLEQFVWAIAYTVEARDPYTAGHERRVGELAVAIAHELGLSEERIRGIHLAASIHDLGKIQVPAEILSKPGKLSDIEFMLIKTHPQAGYDILKDVDFPWPIADIVHQHHERMDGSGYPQGLKDGQILFESRIMAVADVVEAMSSHRPYRAALGIESALKEIERGRGTVYDTTVADACLRLFREERFGFSG